MRAARNSWAYPIHAPQRNSCSGNALGLLQNENFATGPLCRWGSSKISLGFPTRMIIFFAAVGRPFASYRRASGDTLDRKCNRVSFFVVTKIRFAAAFSVHSYLARALKKYAKIFILPVRRTEHTAAARPGSGHPSPDSQRPPQGYIPVRCETAPSGSCRL